MLLLFHLLCLSLVSYLLTVFSSLSPRQWRSTDSWEPERCQGDLVDKVTPVSEEGCSHMFDPWAEEAYSAEVLKSKAFNPCDLNNWVFTQVVFLFVLYLYDSSTFGSTVASYNDNMLLLC